MNFYGLLWFFRWLLKVLQFAQERRRDFASTLCCFFLKSAVEISQVRCVCFFSSAVEISQVRCDVFFLLALLSPILHAEKCHVALNSPSQCAFVLH